MAKELSEMSLEELWELFPIFLVAHSDKWELYYDEIETLLKSGLSACPVERISHIGSTAITGIWAKDIVDVLIEVSRDSEIENTAKTIETNGFIRMSTEANRISFNRGYMQNGFAEKVFHAHLRYIGDNDELYFRDYLNDYPQIAKEYETMKLQLWKRFEHNRDAYTNAKTAFIRKWTSKAKKVYAGRY
ncbi:MAG: GrpB family protein [Clostridiales bacterium]|nr:GrpB family protein [Clostridiales bacterium]